MALGSSSPLEIRTFRLVPLSLDTSITSRAESVQYRLRPIQSTANPVNQNNDVSYRCSILQEVGGGGEYRLEGEEE